MAETVTGELDPRAAGARRLENKVCVVTGAGQGIGRATARRLGQEDLGTFAGAGEMMDTAMTAFGRIDVLVNNVGGTIWMKPFHLYSEEEVKLELERSLLPTLWGCRAVLPIMMEQKAGSIINIGSQSVRGLYRAPYASSKGGILALGKVLSMEEGDEYRREMSADIRSQQALRRRGMPEEHAAAVAFLASDDASFVTGDVINCSGGQS